METFVPTKVGENLKLAEGMRGFQVVSQSTNVIAYKVIYSGCIAASDPQAWSFMLAGAVDSFMALRDLLNSPMLNGTRFTVADLETLRRARAAFQHSIGG